MFVASDFGTHSRDVAFGPQWASLNIGGFAEALWFDNTHRKRCSRRISRKLHGRVAMCLQPSAHVAPVANGAQAYIPGTNTVEHDFSHLLKQLAFLSIHVEATLENTCKTYAAEGCGSNS